MNIGVYIQNSKMLNLIERTVEFFIEHNNADINLIDWTDPVNALLMMENIYCDGLIISITDHLKSSNIKFITSFIKQYPHADIIVIYNKLECIDWILKYKIFSYICEKNIKYELKNSLNILFDHLAYKNNKVLELISKRKYEKLFFSEILFINRDGKNIKIYTTDNRCITYRTSLLKVFEKLDENIFSYIDKGCIINISFIVGVNSQQVRLRNGLELPVSRQGQKKLLQIVNN